MQRRPIYTGPLYGRQTWAHFTELNGAHLLTTTSCRRHYTNKGADFLHRHYHNIADGVFKSRKIAVYLCFYLGHSKMMGVSETRMKSKLLGNVKSGHRAKMAAKKKGERLDGRRIDLSGGKKRCQVSFPDDILVMVKGNNSTGCRSVHHLTPFSVGYVSGPRSTAVNTNPCKQGGAHEITCSHRKTCPSRPADDNPEGQP